MDSQPQHDHGEFHKGLVPNDQLAGGVATAGFVPVSGDGGFAEWAAQTGGGSGTSACEHQHQTEEFSASGGSPETFTLAYAPMWSRRCYLQGARLASADVGGSGQSIEITTSGGDVVIVDYERECSGSGVIGDGDPAGFKTLGWYVWGTEADFAAQSPVAWVADTLYEPGAIIAEAGTLFARYPNTSRLSDSIGNEPDWGSVAEGDFVSDLNGYWQRLPDGFDVTAALDPWATSTQFGYGLLGDDCAYITPSVSNGFVYCAEVLDTYLTGSVEPVWPTDPCGGGGTFFVDFGDLVMARAYTPGSVNATLNGVPIDPGDLTEQAPDEGVIYFTGSANPEDVIVVSSAAVC